MRWIVSLDGRDASRGIAWARAFLARVDTSRVEWIRIDVGRGRFAGAYGRCWYPDRNRETYRISCQVPGPFPATVRTRKPPIYERPDGTWPFSEGNPDGTPVAAAPPGGSELGAFVEDTRDGRARRWFRVVGRTQLRDVDEAVVWILAHEAFHYLRRTRQVPGRNTEIEADAFADRRLDEFRAETEDAPARPGEVPDSPDAQVVTNGRCRMPKPKKGSKGKRKQSKPKEPKRKAAEVKEPEPGQAEAPPTATRVETRPLEQPDEPKAGAKPNSKKESKKGRKARAVQDGPQADLDALRSKAAEARAAFEAATAEAAALRAKADESDAAAKRAYAEALAPYREACHKTGQPCEFPGIKAPSTFPRARFLIERVRGGLKVRVKDRPKTEETIPDKQLSDSVWRAARDYCARHFGEEVTGGRCRGLGLRFRAALAGK